VRKGIVLLCCCIVFAQADLFADNEGKGSAATKYDVTEEAIIHADPGAVYNAIIDLYDGKTSWWLPDFSSRLCDGASSGDIGALYEVTIHALCPITFMTRTVQAIQNEMLVVDYVGGAFIGQGVWTFEDVAGNTKISLRWRTNPGSLFMRRVAPFYPVAKNHSSVMQAGFRRLDRFLNQ